MSPVPADVPINNVVSESHPVGWGKDINNNDVLQTLTCDVDVYQTSMARVMSTGTDFGLYYLIKTELIPATETVSIQACTTMNPPTC